MPVVDIEAAAGAQPGPAARERGEALVTLVAPGLAGAAEPTSVELKEALRAIDGLGGTVPAEDCRAAGAWVLELARTHGVLGRGLLVMHANLLAGLGDAAGAARTIIAAFETEPTGFTESHALAAWKRVKRLGADEESAFVAALTAAGVPLLRARDTDALLAGLAAARDRYQLTAAIDQLAQDGGLPDVVAAGRAFSLLRTKPGRTAEHVTRLFDLAVGSSGLSPRVVNDALIVLAELGAADESRYVLDASAAVGLIATASHRLSYVTALSNGMRFDEALEAYQQYLDEGFPATDRARKVQVQALCQSERTSALHAALLTWSEAVRTAEVGDPPAGLLTTAIISLLHGDDALVVDLVQRTADAFTYNEAHRVLVLDRIGRSRSLTPYALAVHAFTAVGMPPTTADLNRLVELTDDQTPADVVAALAPLMDLSGDARRQLALPLALAQIATGDLEAATRTARLARVPAVVEALVEVQLQTGDVDGALRTAEILDGERGRERAGREMRQPPAMVARIVRVLAATRGVDEAERWLARYRVGSWPTEAWGALALAHRRDRGNHQAIDRIMRRMRGIHRVPSGEVWEHWLYSFPRPKRACRVARAREQMAEDGVAPTAGFFTAAVVGALLPAKVQPSPGREIEDIAWDNARTAIRDGEELLVEAVSALARRRQSKGAAGSWFTPEQLLEIARAYPLRRRPYAQLDAAVEVRLGAEAEPDEQFAALLTAIAAAHARALLPEGVERLRAAAAPLRLDGAPDLVAALLDAHRGQPENAAGIVRAELEAGAVTTAAVAQAAGQLLAASGSEDAVLDILDAAEEADVDRELVEELASAAVLALAQGGGTDVARRLGAAAEARQLTLTPTAQAGLLTTQRPEEPVAAEQGPVWTTSQLAAYNSLLEHELGNHLRSSSEDIDLLGVVLDNLRRQVPAEVAPTVSGDLEMLEAISASLRRTRGLQRRSLAKIAAAADLERTSAGTVPVLAAIDSVVEQLADQAADAGSTVTVLDREGCARMAVRGHATLLQFAVHNLVSNAVKAHKRRGDGRRRTIELLATFAESDRDDLTVAPFGWVVVSVRDHGDGVPEDLPDNVANWSIPGQPGQGAGIGLRVTENMIRQSGGQLWIDTSVADGSRFCFRLPSAARRDARAAHRSTREEDNRG